MSRFNSRYSVLQIGVDEAIVAVAMDGAAPTTESTEANNDTANDMTLLPAVPAENDAYYFGAAGEFDGVVVNIGTAGVGTWTITWEYYDGNSWEALSDVSDATVKFTAAAGEHLVTFTRPTDWATVAVNALTKYWIRARVSAYSAVTTQPLGTQAWLIRDLTGYITEIDGLPGERELQEDTTIGATAYRRDPGLENSPLRLAGVYDDTTYYGPDAVLGPLRTHTSAVHVFYGPEGKTTTKKQYTGKYWVRNYKVTTRVKEMVLWTAELESNTAITRTTYT